MSDEREVPMWKWPGLGGRLVGSRDHRVPDEAVLHGRRLHAIIEENAARIAQEEAERREGQAVCWLRANWPWYLRWAIGYPRAIAALDRLGLVVLPVFVEERDH